MIEFLVNSRCLVAKILYYRQGQAFIVW